MGLEGMGHFTLRVTLLLGSSTFRETGSLFSLSFDGIHIHKPSQLCGHGIQQASLRETHTSSWETENLTSEMCLLLGCWHQTGDGGTLSSACFGLGWIESSPGLSTGYEEMENHCSLSSAPTDAAFFTASRRNGQGLPQEPCMHSGARFQLHSSAPVHCACPSSDSASLFFSSFI